MRGCARRAGKGNGRYPTGNMSSPAPDPYRVVTFESAVSEGFAYHSGSIESSSPYRSTSVSECPVQRLDIHRPYLDPSTASRIDGESPFCEQPLWYKNPVLVALAPAAQFHGPCTRLLCESQASHFYFELSGSGTPNRHYTLSPVWIAVFTWWFCEPSHRRTHHTPPNTPVRPSALVLYCY